MKVKSEREVAQSCLTLSDPMDCSLPGSSIHGIFRARVLEWGATAFSRSQTWGNPKCQTPEAKTNFSSSLFHELLRGSVRCNLFSKVLESLSTFHLLTRSQNSEDCHCSAHWTHLLALTPEVQPCFPATGLKEEKWKAYEICFPFHCNILRLSVCVCVCWGWGWCVCVCMFSCVLLFGTLWTVAYQAPLSMEFSRWEYWSGLPFPPPEDLPDAGIKTESPALVGNILCHGTTRGGKRCIQLQIFRVVFTFSYTTLLFRNGFAGGSAVKNPPARQETWTWSLGWEDPLEKEMATHSSILAWRIPWTEETDELQSMGSQSDTT